MQEAQFLTIGATNSRKVQFWEQALVQKNISHRLLDYQQIIHGDFPEITSPTILRITSTGENFALWKAILRMGDCPFTEQFHFQKGLIYPNAYWYRGWCKMLQGIANFINKNPLLQPINSPASIQLAFHKLKCCLLYTSPSPRD